MTTATGEQRKIELGNAVATLGDVSTRVEQTSITNMSDLLVAKVAGMVVIPGAFTNGAPMIRIRGLNSLSLNNSPIFVVDGVRMNIGGSSSNGGNLASGISVINDIDPSTIEDVEIVKGPSAATLYGTDAANGVVVITTKRGKAGKNRWTFNAEQGSLVDKSNYLDRVHDLGPRAERRRRAARCLHVHDLGRHVRRRQHVVAEHHDGQDRSLAARAPDSGISGMRRRAAARRRFAISSAAASRTRRAR